MKRLMISLPEKTIQEAKLIAEIKQLPYTTLFRTWIAEKVREYASATACKQTTDAASTTA